MNIKYKNNCFCKLLGEIYQSFRQTVNRFVILEHCYTTAYSGNENTTNTGNSAEVAKSYYNWKEITTWAERKEGFKRGKSIQEICIFFKTAWVYIPHTSNPPPSLKIIMP